MDGWMDGWTYWEGEPIISTITVTNICSNLPPSMCTDTPRCMKMCAFQILPGMLLRNQSFVPSYTVGVFPCRHVELYTILFTRLSDCALLRTKSLSSLGLTPRVSDCQHKMPYASRAGEDALALWGDWNYKEVVSRGSAVSGKTVYLLLSLLRRGED